MKVFLKYLLMAASEGPDEVGRLPDTDQDQRECNVQFNQQHDNPTQCEKPVTPEDMNARQEKDSSSSTTLSTTTTAANTTASVAISVISEIISETTATQSSNNNNHSTISCNNNSNDDDDSEDTRNTANEGHDERDEDREDGESCSAMYSHPTLFLHASLRSQSRRTTVSKCVSASANCLH